MASSSLYPPIIAYSMPAFAVDEQGASAVTGQSSDNTVRVYFALSSYNNGPSIAINFGKFFRFPLPAWAAGYIL